jgi:hypothetical protein
MKGIKALISIKTYSGLKLLPWNLWKHSWKRYFCSIKKIVPCFYHTLNIHYWECMQLLQYRVHIDFISGDNKETISCTSILQLGELHFAFRIDGSYWSSLGDLSSWLSWRSTWIRLIARVSILKRWCI